MDETTYTLTEDAEDYKSESAQVAGYTDPTSGSTDMDDPEVKTSFTNTRSGTIPTGVAAAVGPFAALTGAAGLGLLLVNRKKRRA